MGRDLGELFRGVPRSPRLFEWRSLLVRRFVGVCVVVFLLSIPGLALAGLNGDGNTDVVFTHVDGGVCLGDGSGGFVCSDLDFGPTGTRDVAVGHIDHDGNLDLVFGMDRVCLGDGSGGFVCGDISMVATDTSQVALGDVNHDGDVDVVAANNGPNRVCLGDGTGGFVCVDLGLDNEITGGVALGDVNGDGDVDAVFANYGSAFTGARNTVCLGDGTGAFVCTDISTISDSSLDVQLGDVNDDGDVDAVFSSHPNNSYAHSTVCLGDGSGGFACQALGSDAIGGATRLALGDVNGDGHLDAVVASDGGRNRVCLGDGNGGFSCDDVSTDTNSTWDVGVVDVDRDGHLDAVFANLNDPVGQRDRVCLGNGTGLFTCSDVSTDVRTTHGLAVAPGHRGTFFDDDFNVFEADIEWMAGEGITKGCNPPTNDLFCPDSTVTRGQMAAFLVRALGLTDDGGGDLFVDDDESIFEGDIDRMATAGITKGCNPPVNDRFCPDAEVTRGQMAAFLVRALGYTDDGGGDLFTDDDGSVFEGDIDRLGTAGVTKGCNPPTNDRYCPDSAVTRGQMAAFLHRALG